jgi:hypothetical protein
MTWNPLMAQGTFETVQQNGSDAISLEAVFMGIIGVGSACILGWIIVKLGSIIKLLIQAKTIQKTPPKLLLSNAVKGPFSFLNTIVFPTHLYRSEAYELMLTHEKIHVKQWHSLDILLTNFLLVMAWWNPFLWVYRKSGGRKPRVSYRPTHCSHHQRLKNLSIYITQTNRALRPFESGAPILSFIFKKTYYDA